MKTIYKYKLEVTDEQVIQLHSDYKILSVKEQYSELVLWAVVDTEKPKTNVTISIVGTGHEIKERDELFSYWEYIDTVMSYNGLVWHVFDNKQ